mmetsp:Transcript_2881/g.8595  ORF Transcript_2881/g.8595 Transcript_2881/m.8595 type:complete len:329 (-) Transcript_2881:1234-2220(-)
MHLLPSDRHHVDGESCHNHRLAFSCAYLRYKGPECGLLLALQKTLEGQEAYNLRVVRQHQQVEPATHGKRPMVEDLAESLQDVPVGSGARAPQLLQHCRHILLVDQTPVIRKAHQLAARCVRLCCPLQVMSHGRPKTSILLLELQVCQCDVFALNVLQEEEHGLNMGEQPLQVLRSCGLVLHNRVRPGEEDVARGAGAAVHEPEADVQVNEVKGPELRPGGHLAHDEPLDRIGVGHRLLLPRQEDLDELLQSSWVALAQHQLRELRLFEDAEQPLTVLHQDSRTSGRVLHLVQDLRQSVVHSPPCDQSLPCKVHDSFNNAFAVSKPFG